jgi:hypothetical protein
MTLHERAQHPEAVWIGQGSKHRWTVGSLTFVLSLMAAVLWPVTSIWKSRAALQKEQEYRELSDHSARSPEGSDQELRTLRSTVVSLNGRVEVLEKMLAEVE